MVPVYFRDIHHVVGTVWPVGLAREFVDWFAVTKDRFRVRSRHGLMTRWSGFGRVLNRNGRCGRRCRVWWSIDDDVPSVAQSNQDGGRPKDRGRRAIFFAG